MGSIITLGLERLEIDWGKNWNFTDHSKLFLPTDIAPALYHYVEADTGEPVTETKPAYVRPLRSVIRRLELLGYSLADCRRIYAETMASVPDYYPPPALSFDLFARAVAAADPTRMRLSDPDEDWNLGEYVAKNILVDPEFTKTADELRAMTESDGTFFENLDPYVTLRLLGENSENLDRLVIWRFEDVVEGGYVDESDVYHGLEDADRYLVVTEGSSDSSILRESLPYVAPDVADFFSFADMTENYPFTGTGNLVRFCQGLAQIRIQNRIVVVLDNDTAGRSAFERIRRLPLPPTMRVMLLPSLPDLSRVRTIGPGGEAIDDANGRAVAIEAFLDLGFERTEEPTIRWTSYDRQVDAYQGELVDKDRYVQTFMRSLGKEQNYDVSKLDCLWTNILACCSSGA